jgi:hypothetical protein
MRRISLVNQSNAGWFGRLAYKLSRKRFGKVAESLATTAHHRGILFGVCMMERALGGASLLPLKLKTLASIRAATLIGCPF